MFPALAAGLAFAERLHPYTMALFAAYPDPDPDRREGRTKVIMGDVPSPIRPPSGCHFHPRCPHRMAICDSEYPRTKEVRPGHFVACQLYSAGVGIPDKKKVLPERPHKEIDSEIP